MTQSLLDRFAVHESHNAGKNVQLFAVFNLLPDLVRGLLRLESAGTR